MAQRSKQNRPPPLPDPGIDGHELFRVLVLCGALILVVLLVFGQTSQFNFIVCDDVQYVYGNPNVASGLKWENIRWALTTTHAGNWHPLTWLSHMLDAQIYGAKQTPNYSDAGGHHLTNVWLHAVAVVVLFLALRQMTRATWLSALTAAMFAVHPLRVESVAWVAERKDVLSGAFWMLTLLGYGWYARRPTVGRYWAVAVPLALGLSAKSMLVTLPCVLLLLDYWPLGRWRKKEKGERQAKMATVAEPRFPACSLGRLILEKLPLFGLTLVVAVVVAIGQRGAGAMNVVGQVSLDIRAANAAISYVVYLWKTVWPVHLAFFYPNPAVLERITAWWWAGAACSAIFLAAVTVAALWNWRSRPYLVVGWLWYLGALAPVIGLVQIGAHAYADRYTYLPSIGIYLAAVWGAAEWVGRRPRLRIPAIVAASAIILTWTGLAIHQTSTWKDNWTVFGHAIDATSDNYFAHNHMGVAYQDIGDIEKAGRHYAEAVRITPNYDSANGNLGVYYSHVGQADKAVEYFERAVQINPYVGAHRANLAMGYLRQGRNDKAIEQLRAALDLNPRDAGLRIQLARTFYQQGKLDEMLSELREAIRLRPNDLMLLNETAWLLATCPDDRVRNGSEAVDLAGRAVQLTGAQEPLVLGTLAAAYAEASRFDEAVEAARDAVELAVRQKKRELAESLRAKLALYQSKKPYRMPAGPPPSRNP